MNDITNIKLIISNHYLMILHGVAAKIYNAKRYTQLDIVFINQNVCHNRTMENVSVAASTFWCPILIAVTSQ